MRADAQPLWARLPWALFGAIALVVGLDVGLRLSHWPHVVPYELGLDEYYAVAATLDVGDPAEVAFVGSSRTRESIHLPTLAPLLTKAAGRPVSVASYAMSRARAFDFESVIRRLLREAHRPRIILCGISERDMVRGIDDAFDMAPVFWNAHDFRVIGPRLGTKAMEYLPLVVRNEIGLAWRALQLRESLRMRIVDLVLRVPPDAVPSPLRGQLTPFHKFDRRKSLAYRPLTAERVADYVQSLHVDEGLPHEQMMMALEGLIRACNDANVTLILYEPPTPQMFRDYLPPGVYEQFHAVVADAAERGKTRWVQVEELPVRLGKHDFREQSHMNLRGAKAFTTAFGEAVIARTLRRSIEDERDRKLKKKRTAREAKS